jgi:hypothetical protein
MLNATSLLSRFSRGRKTKWNALSLTRYQTLEGITAGIADAGCKTARLSQCALEKFVQCACGGEDWPG